MQRMLTVRMVAAALGLSDERVRQLIRLGRLAGARRIGARKLAVPESAVIAYLQGRPLVGPEGRSEEPSA